MSRIAESHFGDSLATYPNTPGYQNATTSKAAANDMKPRHLRLHTAILQALRARPMTADETAITLDITVLACRPRIAELNKLGKIDPSGEYRFNESGKSAIVWKVR